MRHAIAVAKRRRCYDVSNGRNRNMRSEIGECLLEWAMVVALFAVYVAAQALASV